MFSSFKVSYRTSHSLLNNLFFDFAGRHRESEGRSVLLPGRSDVRDHFRNPDIFAERFPASDKGIPRQDLSRVRLLHCESELILSF